MGFYPGRGAKAVSGYGLRAAAILLLAQCAQPAENSKPIITEGALADVVYEPAQRLVSRSCADCHAEAGNNASHSDAWGHAIRLDTYEEWVNGRRVLLERLDPATAAAHDPPLDPMPTAGFPYPLSDAERDTLLRWIERGSPNTVAGE